jgi:hypothetical protein
MKLYLIKNKRFGVLIKIKLRSVKEIVNLDTFAQMAVFLSKKGSSYLFN